MVKNMLKVVLGSTPSDSHIWNLIYLELLMLELNCEVVNLGSCISKEDWLTAVKCHRPDLVVISSLNGSLYQDGISLITEIKDNNLISSSHFIIGGQISDPYKAKKFIEKKLLKHGYSAVFIMDDVVERFKSVISMMKLQRQISQVAF